MSLVFRNSTVTTKFASQLILCVSIQSMDDFQDAAAQSAIAEYLEDKAPKAAKTPKAKTSPATSKTKAPTAKKSTKASREAEALAQARAVAQADAELEDAPF